MPEPQDPTTGELTFIGTATVLLRVGGFTVLTDLRITSMPGRHAPQPLEALLPPVMGSMLEFGTTGGSTEFRLYADQGVQALRIVRPRTAVPIHYHDYTVFKDPLERFQQAVAQASLPTDVRYVPRGEPWRFAVRGTSAPAAPE